jgi:uncharacterized membrane protein YdjX (TVP38/TMEM64 family)
LILSSVTHVIILSSILNVGAGFLFKFGVGFITALVGVNLGSAVAFWLSRRFLYERVQKKVQGFKTFQVSGVKLSVCSRWIECDVFDIRVFVLLVVVSLPSQTINASLESNDGWWNALKMVLLARLPPLFPFPLFNYAFGLTNVRLAYDFWSPSSSFFFFFFFLHLCLKAPLKNDSH